jgi:predicted transcriptional regulator
MKITFGDKFAKVYLNALYDERLTRSDVLVLTVLDRFADNDTRTATVSRATIASVAKMSNNTLSTCLTRLEESGYVIIQERHSKKDGSRLSNAYTLTVSEYAEVSDDMAKTFSEAMCEVIEEVESEEDVVDFSGSKEEWCVKSTTTETPKKPVLKKVKKSTPKTTTPKIGREVGSTNNEPMRLVNKYKTTTTTTRRGLITVTHSINRNISKVIDGVECVQHTITTTSDSEEPVTNIYMEPVDWKSWSEKSMEERKKFFRMGIKRRNL